MAERLLLLPKRFSMALTSNYWKTKPEDKLPLKLQFMRVVEGRQELKNPKDILQKKLLEHPDTSFTF